MERKTWAGLGAATIVLLAILAGYIVTDKTYVCEQRGIISECEHFSSSGITCYPHSNNFSDGTRCYEGWKGSVNYQEEYEYELGLIKVVNTYEEECPYGFKDNSLVPINPHQLCQERTNPFMDNGFIIGYYPGSYTFSPEEILSLCTSGYCKIGYNSTFITTLQSDFDLGTYNKTFYNTTENALQLNLSYYNGTYLSQSFDSSSTETTWNNYTMYLDYAGGLNSSEDSSYFNYTGIVSRWGFEGNAQDTEGNNDGIVSGATLTSNSKVGSSAYDFDGVNDAINTTDIDYSMGKFTGSVWVKLKGTISGKMFFQGDSTDLLQLQYDGASLSNTFRFRIDTAGGNCVAVSTTEASLNEWYHVVGTYNGSQNNIYVNGQLESSDTTSCSGAIDNFVNSFSIGANALESGFGSFINATIDEVAIFNRTLSDSEIENLYLRGVTKINGTIEISNSSDFTNSYEIDFLKTPSVNIPSISGQYARYNLYLDTVSNTVTPNVYNVTFDYTSGDTPPTVNLISPPDNEINITTTSFDFKCNATDDFNLSNMTFYLSDNNSLNWIANETIILGNTSNHTQSFTKSLRNGVYEWSCGAFDSAGAETIATNYTLTVNFTIPNDAPNVTIISPVTGTYDRNWLFIEYNVSDLQNDTVDCDIIGDSVTIQSNNSLNTTGDVVFNINYNWTNISYQEHTVQVQCDDTKEVTTKSVTATTRLRITNLISASEGTNFLNFTWTNPTNVEWTSNWLLLDNVFNGTTTDNTVKIEGLSSTTTYNLTVIPTNDWYNGTVSSVLGTTITVTEPSCDGGFADEFKYCVLEATEFGMRYYACNGVETDATTCVTNGWEIYQGD